jgi:homogentisate phytyltransferase/homogentisate geranylgeranyltransferase
VTITRPIAFATAFMLLFSVVIALFKDIPDVAGDSQVGGWTGGWGGAGKWVGGWDCDATSSVARLGCGLLGGLSWARHAMCAVGRRLWVPSLVSTLCAGL